MKPFLTRRPRLLAYSLVELLVTVAIISILLAICLPNFQYMILRAQGTRCMTQLHGIGAAVVAAANDNNGLIPEIDQAATNVYVPAGRVPGLVGVLGRYGVATNDIQCPVDMAYGGASSFQQYHSSYEWNPIYDDGSYPPKSIVVDKIQIGVDTSLIRLCTDFVAIHNHKVNALYADGHVAAQ